MENKFMRVEEVAEVLEVSTSFAYKVIRQLNDELKANAWHIQESVSLYFNRCRDWRCDPQLDTGKLD